MATRRIVSNERTILDKDDPPTPVAGKPGKSVTAPAVPTSVIMKLLGFTAAMVTLPIGTYYLTVNTIFKGSATLAGGTAALMANVVLIAYVIAAMKEDQSEQLAEKEKSKKGQ